MSTYSTLRGLYDDLETRVRVLEKMLDKALGLKGTDIEPSAPSRVSHILQEVAAKHKLTVYLMLNGRRGPKYVEARWEAMYRLRNEIVIRGEQASYPQIAQWIGVKDHTTVMHGVKQFILLEKKKGGRSPLVDQQDQETPS